LFCPQKGKPESGCELDRASWASWSLINEGNEVPSQIRAFLLSRLPKTGHFVNVDPLKEGQTSPGYFAWVLKGGTGPKLLVPAAAKAIAANAIP
jgi:hypothetical protein